MTGPEDSYSNTRPISVAELLAKNGTIGAPPVGGRRRRRRGNSDAVTVAELTGEIPIITDDTPKEVSEPATGEPDDHTGAAPGNGVVEHVDERTEDTAVSEVSDQGTLTEEEADYAAHLEEREAEPMFFEPPPRRPQYPGLGPKRYPGRVGAEEMSPDPVDIDDDDAVEAVASDQGRPAPTATTDTEDDVLPSYLRSSGGTLFGGDTVADEAARRRGPALDDLEFGAVDLEHDEDDDLDVDEDLDVEHETPMSSFARGALVVGQCIVAVLFGAGLFIAFDQLWKWNNIVALVLSVLVILGLVVGVRVVRKTEDIGSTLIAVAVGALVTLGPLALLRSG
ncbi:hypothetical protein A5662_25520 [Mycobacteriaceae bacterium 1482268.1]|nr:hypothetical protein A5662_25520 [Mycobacteriaceae bacterium 1482268.1]